MIEQGGCIKCDCCGKQTLAEIKDGKLVIYDTRHGQRHFVVVSVHELTTFAIGGIIKVDTIK